MIEARFRPQLRLAEVGQAGMEKIQKARFTVHEQPGAWVEHAYLARAGGQVHLAEGASACTSTPEFAHQSAFHHSAAEEIAAGSWRALRQLRQTLGILG